MRSTKLDHIARTNEKNIGLAQVTEHPLGQTNGSGRHRYRMCSDGCFGADGLAHRESGLKQSIHLSAQRAGHISCAHRVHHLAEELWFDEHHKFKSTNHAESMSDCFVVFLAI